MNATPKPNQKRGLESLRAAVAKAQSDWLEKVDQRALALKAESRAKRFLIDRCMELSSALDPTLRKVTEHKRNPWK